MGQDKLCPTWLGAKCLYETPLFLTPDGPVLAHPFLTKATKSIHTQKYVDETNGLLEFEIWKLLVIVFRKHITSHDLRTFRDTDTVGIKKWERPISSPGARDTYESKNVPKQSAKKNI